MKKVLCLSLAVILIIASLTSCQKSADSEDKGYEASVIRIAVSDFYLHSSLHLLMLTGMLEDMLPDDVSVEWPTILTSTDARDALVTENVDFGGIISPTVFSALSNDLPLTIVSSLTPQTAMVYSTRPDIQSLDNIGKADKIATPNIGGALHLALIAAAKEKYGDYSWFDDNLMVMSHDNMLITAESTDELACIMEIFPHTIVADNSDKLFPVYDLNPILNQYGMTTLVVANSNFYKKNPVLVDIMEKALRKAVDYINEKPEEAAQILAEFYSGVSAADVEGQIRLAPPELEISEAAFNKTSELMNDVGILQKQLKLSDLPNYDRIIKKT